MKAKKHNYIKRHDYRAAYEEMKANRIPFDFDSISTYFKKNDAVSMYRFLMYAISREETAQLHLAICYYLFFMDPIFSDNDSLIKWHLVRAFDISHDEDVLNNWIFGIYSGNPDCPFSDEELDYYRTFLPDKKGL